MSNKDPITKALPLSEPELAAITTACRLHQVQQVHVFGSALRAVFDPNRSDAQYEHIPGERAALSLPAQSCR